MDSGADRSQLMLLTAGTGHGRRDRLYTWKPSSRNASAAALPIPTLAPLIIAVFNGLFPWILLRDKQVFVRIA